MKENASVFEFKAFVFDAQSVTGGCNRTQERETENKKYNIFYTSWGSRLFLYISRIQHIDIRFEHLF